MKTDEMHPCSLSVDQLLRQCRVQRGRASGPGGQHRNKVETAVLITHLPTGVRGEATERRSQQQNFQQAIQRLRVNLAIETRVDRTQKDSPSLLWQQRCRSGRFSVSVVNQDFPALLAEALDTLVVCEMDVKSAADSLAITNTQLVKLLKVDTKALQWVNATRKRQGLYTLR